jgi:hypothetical protein
MNSLENIPKTFQVPKSTHPWRRYTNTITSIKVEVEETTYIPVREFLANIVGNWDHCEIVLPSEFEGSYKHFLRNLPQSKQASWIAGMLRRAYVEKSI